MASVIFYEVALGLIGLFFSIIFLYVLDKERYWDFKRPFYKFTAALTFMSVLVITQIIEQTWTVYSFRGIYFPPLHVIFEALVMGFLISGLWGLMNLNTKK